MAEIEIERLEESGTNTETPLEEEMLKDDHVDPDPVENVRDWSNEIQALSERISGIETGLAAVQKAIMDSRTTTEVSDVDDGSDETLRIADLFEYED